MEGERVAEVAAGETSEEAGELGRQREVEAEVVPERGDVRRGGRFPEHDLHGIAGDEPEHGEDEQRRPEQRDRNEREPAEHEAAHHRTRAAARPWRSPLGLGAKPSSRREATTIFFSNDSGTTGRSCAARRWMRV